MIDLVFHKGFAWHREQDCHVKGFAFSPEQEYLEGKYLAAWFSQATSAEDFSARASGINGMFSVVLERDDATWIVVDPARCFPLYYRVLDRGIHVSDSVDRLNEGVDWSFNPAGMEEYLAAGFVSGQETLVQDICQVEAGQMVVHERGETSRHFYWSYGAENLRSMTFEEGLAELDEATSAMYGRLEASLAGRTAVVALSGGYDSRFLLALLHQHGYEKIICFSYGREGNPEMKVAGAVARKLGVKYIPVVYGPDLIRAFEQQQDFKDYVDFSSNFTSMFFMQEYFAVKFLKDERLLPDDAVFIPGHSGDFLAGSQLIKHGLHSGQEGDGSMLDRIYRTKYGFCPSSPQRMKKRIRTTLLAKRPEEGALPFTLHEDWDLKEKLSKVLVNSCNVYAWFGFEYRLPFYDRVFMEFFRNLPFGFKADKALYDQYLREGIFRELDLNMEREGQPTLVQQKNARWKGAVKRMVPPGLIPRKPGKNDDIFYREITARLVEDMRARGVNMKIHGGAYNSLLIQWYVESLKLKYPGKGVST